MGRHFMFILWVKRKSGNNLCTVQHMAPFSVDGILELVQEQKRKNKSIGYHQTVHCPDY